MITKKIKDTAVRAAKKAGQELLKGFNNFDRSQVRLKSSHEILTKADLAAEKIILGIIGDSFPEHRILSEEKGDSGTKSDYLWVVDPLDGTTNFSIHNPLFAVSIAVFFRQQLLLGVIYAPFLKELFVAVHGEGAWLNGERIKVSGTNKQKIINTYCHGSKDRDIRLAVKYLSRQKLRHLDCRQLGSAALELSFVACGRIESIMIPGAHSWDVAAGVLLVREAGGRVTDFKDQEWGLKSNDILASNGRVHKDILKTINKLDV